jgi:ATP-dependent helicase/DNAse subunit B
VSKISIALQINSIFRLSGAFSPSAFKVKADKKKIWFRNFEVLESFVEIFTKERMDWEYF